MQSLECVELLLFVLLPKMSVPDIKNRGLLLLIISLSYLDSKSPKRNNLFYCSYTAMIISRDYMHMAFI